MTNKKITVGLCGNGFVGNTCYKVFSQVKGYDVKVYDKDPWKTLNTLEEVAQCEIVFVCLPTPMTQKTGQCYTSIVEGAVDDLRRLNKDNSIVIKSTVEPKTNRLLNEKYGNIFFNPEFLTEVNAYEDFITLPYQILGVSNENQDHENNPVVKLFNEAYRQSTIKAEKTYIVSYEMAEMIKYTRNTYLATRLSFFNEIKQISDKLSVDYNTLKKLVGLDLRVGDHYNRIDEDEPEYSGSCLCKDINGLIYFANTIGVDPKMLKAGWAKNLEVAKKRTWEKMEGRAVITKKI